MNQYIEETKKGLLHTYNQFPAVLERGEGVYLFDTEGKKYLDFAAGYAVSSLGYGNKELNEALKAQIDKLPGNTWKLLKSMASHLYTEEALVLYHTISCLYFKNMHIKVSQIKKMD